MCMRVADSDPPRFRSKRVFRSPTNGLYLLIQRNGKWHTPSLSESGSIYYWAQGRDSAKDATAELEPVEIGTLLEVVE